jgi:hypothetical protein
MDHTLLTNLHTILLHPLYTQFSALPLISPLNTLHPLKWQVYASPLCFQPPPPLHPLVWSDQDHPKTGTRPRSWSFGGPVSAASQDRTGPAGLVFGLCEIPKDRTRPDHRISTRGYEINQKRAGVVLLFLFHNDNRPLSATFPKVTVLQTTSSQYIDGLEETILLLLRRWSRLESFQMEFSKRAAGYHSPSFLSFDTTAVNQAPVHLVELRLRSHYVSLLVDILEHFGRSSAH